LEPEASDLKVKVSSLQSDRPSHNSDGATSSEGEGDDQQ
jgi:hypothetical protein